MKLNEKIRILRENKNYSKEELAKLIVSVKYIVVLN